MPKELFTVHFQ